MKLASYQSGDTPSYGIVTDDGIIDLGRRIGDRFPDLRALLAGGESAMRVHADASPDHALNELTWRPVIPNPGQILCVGLNYRRHVEEVGRPLGEWPTIFLRVSQSQIGHQQPIIRPLVSDMLDYEGELAVIVGRGGRHIPAGGAFDHIAGYSLYNDVSVRDWQRHSAQYTAGKNFPATGPFGPWLVTADEIPHPAELELTTRVNGEVVQHASVSELLFPIPELIAYVSTFTELRPGDVLITGTPSGVGSMREPQLWLRPGDLVEVEVPGVGTLANSVEAEPARPGD